MIAVVRFPARVALLLDVLSTNVPAVALVQPFEPELVEVSVRVLELVPPE